MDYITKERKNMTTKSLPIGISDYKKIIEGRYYYIDKTLLIKELIEQGGEVTLITRPRRFGKTLNLSMLRYFFEKPLDNGENTSILFTNTAIWQDEKYRALQGQFPVISLTFKDIKEQNWNDAYAKLETLIATEYQRYQAFITAHKDSINPHQFDIFNQIAAKKATKTDLEGSLKTLTKLLHDITKKRVILLIDEYDSPIHAAHVHGYYNDMIDLMRGLLTTALKDNSFLERGVLTGILRTAKEGIFSGLNNLNVCTFVSEKFSQHFGLLQNEVNLLLQDYQLADKCNNVKDWYNGYRVGERTMIYNPWSLINFVNENGIFQPYWVNTSDNALIKRILVRSNNEVKTELENILNNIPVTKEIDDAMIFPGIEMNEIAIWSLLFFSGYLTYTKKISFEKAPTQYILCIPNTEIELLYRKLLSSFLTESLTTISVKTMLNAMIIGDLHTFSFSLQEFILNSMSHHDFSAEEPEKSYHLFMLGLLVILSDQYTVHSNREVAHGRYDILLTPKDPTQTGIIIELKKAPSPDHFTKTCQEALDQIKEKKYAHELHRQGITHIIAYGIAFFKKELLVTMESKEL